MASPGGRTPIPETTRIRGEVRESLRRLLSSVETQERQVDAALQRLADVPRSDLAEFLSAQRALFLASQEEQMQEWDTLLRSTGLEVREDGSVRRRVFCNCDYYWVTMVWTGRGKLLRNYADGKGFLLTHPRPTLKGA